LAHNLYLDTKKQGLKLLSVFMYDKNTSYPGIVAGTIIDTVSALVFYQSNKARKQMAEFFDKLRYDAKFKESLRMCECINDQETKDKLRFKLSLHFAGYDTSKNPTVNSDDKNKS